MADKIRIQLGEHQWVVDKEVAQKRSNALRQIISEKPGNTIDLSRCYPNITPTGLNNTLHWMNSYPQSFLETARAAATLQMGDLLKQMETIWRNKLAHQTPGFKEATSVPPEYWKNAQAGDPSLRGHESDQWITLQLGKHRWLVSKEAGRKNSEALRQITSQKPWNVIDLARCFPNITPTGLHNALQWLNLWPDEVYETARTAATLQVEEFVKLLEILWNSGPAHSGPGFNQAVTVPTESWKKAQSANISAQTRDATLEWTLEETPLGVLKRVKSSFLLNELNDWNWVPKMESSHSHPTSA